MQSTPSPTKAVSWIPFSEAHKRSLLGSAADECFHSQLSLLGLLQDRNVHFPSRQDQDLYPGIIWLNPLPRSSDKEKRQLQGFCFCLQGS